MPRPHIVRTAAEAAAIPAHLPVQIEFKTRWLTVPIDEEVFQSGDLFKIIAAVRAEVIKQLGSRPRSENVL